MELHTLKPAEGSIKKNIRYGRGPASGKGGTSSRGHKGAKSRSGNKTKRNFEGGQMPLARRVPKFGFKNINRVEFRPVNLDDLQKLAEEKNITSIDLNILIENGLTSKGKKVKILGQGELKAKLEVKAHAFSQTAIKSIEAVGGTIVNI